MIALFTLLILQPIEPVSEDIHSNVDDPKVQMCEVTAPSLPLYEAEVRKQPDVKELQGSTGYTAVALTDRRAIVTFTTAENRAYPAAVCRQITANASGGSSIKTEIRCNGSREDCDWLFRQFEALTARTLGQMEGRR